MMKTCPYQFEKVTKCKNTKRKSCLILDKMKTDKQSIFSLMKSIKDLNNKDNQGWDRLITSQLLLRNIKI